MRQGQQNKRMRGRGRKVQGSLNRVFESNGPDVKIRGPASHIAEKYLNLARDAQSSGDPISAENYLQHAEHYFRIISSAQTQIQQQAPQQQQPQPAFDQSGAELNGAAREQVGGSPSVAAQEHGGDEEPRAQAGAEEPSRKSRRRRGTDGRAQGANGHDAASETKADEAGTSDEDAQSPVEDAEVGGEKPAESAV
ncbi:MAG: DUF4167 domain-containing protein [Hyphomicrobiales bacterium]|nr:DUF4167 domain-containing protein [Hyphomicrobiales bacterium]